MSAECCHVYCDARAVNSCFVPNKSEIGYTNVLISGGSMSETPQFKYKKPVDTSLVPSAADAEMALAAVVSQVVAAPTFAEKSQALLALPAEARYQVLGEMPAALVAAVIDSDPEHNTALIANLPAAKFTQIVGLGTFEQGRSWLERAVLSGSLAGAILPSLMTASDLANMLLTDRDVRRALPRLLNFERAQRWRQLLTTNEYHSSVDELLMADTPELLGKAQFKNKAIRAVLSSLLDFVPELYLEAVNLALDLSKRLEDQPDELEELTQTPFGLPGLAAAGASAATADPNAQTAVSPLEELIPEGGDPVFALATAGLTAARKAELEDQLKNLLRQEIVAMTSFATADMARAAGRVLFYLRAGLESFGPSVEDATQALQTHHLNEISALGAREAERYRQRALSLTGQRDWLDSRQRQFLDALKQPEAGVHPETREPVLFLATRPKQPRAEWHPTPLAQVQTRLADTATWASLARAAFGTPERVHAIFNTAKTRTWEETLRRTVIALVLYHRWEPELVRPAEDYLDFRRQYGQGKRNGIDQARDIVLTALDATPADAWKPSDAKPRSRELLLRAVSEVETMPLPAAPKPPARG